MEQENIKSEKWKSNFILDYLSNVQVFQELHALRTKGWESEAADRHFAKQRTIADTSSSNKQVQLRFHKMMLEIAEEMNIATGVFSSLGNERLLDLCFSPGAFSEYAFRVNPRCNADGISLPTGSGGHEVLLRANRRKVNLSFTDLTLHSKFIPRGKSIPASYPDRAEFDANPHLPPLFSYQLVICDGQRLRTHEHAGRRGWEPRRLLLSQIILGLTYIKRGGSMLILLHKLEQWDTLSFIYRFSKFSDIQLFKPTAGHATRSSFYFIARNIRPEEAVQWVEHLKQCWYQMTFNGEDGRGKQVDIAEDLAVEDLLRDFGPKFIQLGEEVWRRQRDALRSTTWVSSAEGSTKDSTNT